MELWFRIITRKSQGVGQGAETVIWFTDRVSADRCV